uniref:Mitochondrial import receptor subunit TOM7 homolog n=1 Tax=Hucho hucho TaxID=62062 RepID=A0A4W5PK31_9TELE
MAKLSKETKQRLQTVFQAGQFVIRWGFIPTVLYLGQYVASTAGTPQLPTEASRLKLGKTHIWDSCCWSVFVRLLRVSRVRSEVFHGRNQSLNHKPSVSKLLP